MALPALTPFVGYEPNPQGPGYLFQHNSGQKYISYGPAADQLRAQIDAAKRQQQSQMLAQNGMNSADAAASFDAGAPNAGRETLQMNAPGPPVSIPDTGPPPVMAPMPNASPQAPATMEQALEPQRTGTTTVEHVAAPATAPANEPPGRVVPPSGPLPMMRGAVAPGEQPAQPPGPSIPQRGFVYTPGRNPAAEAKNAVAVPTAQSVVTEGGIQDPAARQAALDAFHAQAEAQKNLAAVQENAATTQLETERANLLEAQKRQQDAENAIAAEQARQVLLRKEFDNRMAIAQQDYDKSSSKEIDQYRMFKGSAGATTSGILAVIGAAMGAAGAAYGHNGQNYALQTLQSTINNDVDAQRDEIHRGVAKSSNDLKRISDQYNVDYDDAASILKMNYARRAEAELAKKAALNGTQQAQLAFAQVQPQLQKWQADAAAELNASLNGKVKMVQEARMVQPSRGGISLESDKAYSERLKREAENEANRYKIGHQGAGPPKATPEKTPGEITPNLSRVAVATDNALSSLLELRKKIEASPHVGPIDVGRGLQSASRGGADSDIAAAAKHSSWAVSYAESNSTKPSDERVEELSKTLGSGNRSQQLTHIDALIDQMERKKASIREVSAKTARVGMVGPVSESEGGSEE
jgi:hypothetical protein